VDAGARDLRVGACVGVAVCGRVSSLKVLLGAATVPALHKHAPLRVIKERRMNHPSLSTETHPGGDGRLGRGLQHVARARLVGAVLLLLRRQHRRHGRGGGHRRRRHADDRRRQHGDEVDLGGRRRPRGGEGSLHQVFAGVGAVEADEEPHGGRGAGGGGVGAGVVLGARGLGGVDGLGGGRG
jgi:hypothetical protein